MEETACEELGDLYTSPNIMWVIISRRIDGLACGSTVMRGAYRES